MKTSKKNGWYWIRPHIPLREGHYHHEWLPARVKDGKVQIFGLKAPMPLSAPFLKNALWQGPIEVPAT